MATKKPVFTNPLNYLGIPAGQSPSKPAPKAAVNPTYIPVSDPRYQRQADLKEQALVNAKEKALADAAANKSTTTSSESNQFESKGSIAEDKAKADAAVAAAKAAQQQSMQAIQDDPEYKVLAQKFAAYGMADFPDLFLQVSIDYPKADIQTLQDLLKTDKKYNVDAQGNAKGYAKRFAGNAALIKAGKIPLDDAEYIKAEGEYEKAFKGYGLPTTMLNKESYAKLIANEISADEATTRIKLGYDNLKNNAKVLQAFQTFYPELSQGDIVAAMLNEKEQLPALQRKVTAAQIGGAALRQDLNKIDSNLTDAQKLAEINKQQARAMELEGLGVTQAKAEAGYGKIAGYLTDAQKLARIDKQEEFTQRTAEQSQLEGLASAQRKEAQLAEREINRFSNRVGAARGAFSKDTTF